MATFPKIDPLTVSAEPSSSPSKQQAAGKRTISVSEAKTHLLTVLTELEKQREPITITRRGRPVAQIVPFEPAKRVSAFGCMKGTARITGDIVGSEPDVWEAML